MRAFHKVLLSALAVPLAAMPLIAATQPADAATPACKVSLSGLPTKVTIDATDRRYWVTPTATDCTGLDRSISWVSADAYGPNTTLKRTYSSIWANFGVASHITLPSSDFTAGWYTVLDDGSDLVYAGSYTDMPYTWVRKSFLAKYRGWNTLSARRSGNYVRLTGQIRRYDPTWLGYVPFNRTVSIQRYYGGAWHTIRRQTPVHGTFAYTYKIYARSSYRVVTTATSGTWGAVSATRTVAGR